MALTGQEFEEALAYYAKSWLPARTHVKEALDQRQAVHPSGAAGRVGWWDGVEAAAPRVSAAAAGLGCVCVHVPPRAGPCSFSR